MLFATGLENYPSCVRSTTMGFLVPGFTAALDHRPRSVFTDAMLPILFWLLTRPIPIELCWFAGVNGDLHGPGRLPYLIAPKLHSALTAPRRLVQASPPRPVSAAMLLCSSHSLCYTYQLLLPQFSVVHLNYLAALVVLGWCSCRATKLHRSYHFLRPPFFADSLARTRSSVSSSPKLARRALAPDWVALHGRHNS